MASSQEGTAYPLLTVRYSLLPPYSTFSTSTRMVPPQDRPTFQAVSSATPNSSVLGLPLSITSSASVTTAPSTQPPDTEPRKLPWSSITRFEPTGRGAEPQVSTTVASATPRPAWRHCSAAFSTSSSRASESIAVSIFIANRRSRVVPIRWIAGSAPAMAIGRLGHLVQPSPGVPATLVGQGSHQVGHRFDIVDGPQFVDVGHHGADALGLGL